MSDKLVYNYMKADGSFISYRESMAAFAPTEEEFSQLREKIIRTIGIETSPGFDDTLHFLITLMRDKAIGYAEMESVTQSQKKLAGLKNHLTKLQKYICEDISDTTSHHLSIEIMEFMQDGDTVDPVFALQNNIEVVLAICERTQERIKGQKANFTPIHMRQILAEELARELHKMGVELKKYRNGEFVEVLKHVLKAVPFKVDGQTKALVAIPTDLFLVASKAIDEFPKKEPFPLLGLI
jgi:hypothetical protein|tara:strand:+ start:17450 stop:18166 length:717 start_codon:yes stop_codon:yes gene_type:complete